MLVFLRLHGLTLEAPPVEVTQMMLAVAAGEVSEAEVTLWARRWLTPRPSAGGVE